MNVWRAFPALTLTALIGALVTLGFEAYAAMGLRFLGSRTGLLMTLWTVLPYVTLLAGHWFFAHPRIRRLWLGFAVFEVCVATWMYLQTLWLNPDAQSGLIFLFLPVLQASLNLGVGVALYVWQYRLRRASSE